MTAGGGCGICEALTTPQLLELNAILADPSEWPAEALKDWVIPKGIIPAKMRRWGGSGVTRDWFVQHGLKPPTRNAASKHFASHVVHVAVKEADIPEIGKMAVNKRNGDMGMTVIPEATPKPFIDYYRQGIRLGLYALNRLEVDIEKAEKAGESVPAKTLWQLAELGAKLSMSQASIYARGLRDESEDVGAGFREGSAPLPSQRFGNSRIHTIEGERRPVVDRGRADKIAYNERAAMEGSPKLPV